MLVGGGWTPSWLRNNALSAARATIPGKRGTTFYE